MTPERWQQVREIFGEVLEREPEQRAAFIGKACFGDEDLFREVESLLSSYEQDRSFLETPAFRVADEIETSNRVILSAGQVIAHYEVISLIGEGGMGEVYLARDERLGRRVALKLLPVRFTTDRDRLRRFEQEARSASALSHPNIAHVYELGEVDHHHFIAMEYVEGQTLRERLTQHQMKMMEALEIGIQLASALAAAHSTGVVHRDIKPENLMVCPDRSIKVLDFGISKLIGGQAVRVSGHEAATLKAVKTETGMVIGTAHYMSPEQARGLAVDARTDLWSLGVVLYEMIAGQAPFSGETPSDVVAKIIERDPLPLAQRVPLAPSELDRIVEKALAKDRDERYQTAKDLLIDLRRLKQRLEVEVELERSKSPDGRSSALTGKSSESVEAQALTLESAENKAETQTGEAPRRDTASSTQYIVTEVRRHKSGVMLTLLCLLGIASLGFVSWLWIPAGHPQVTGYIQLTKNNPINIHSIVTDGTRIYYSADEGRAWGNYAVSVTGGEAIPLPKTSLDAMITDISADGTEFLMNEIWIGDIFPLWVQPVLGGSPRRVANVLAFTASWSPDGKQIAYCSNLDLMVAGADGAEPRKLASTKGPCESPTWSADGQNVRFTRGGGGKVDEVNSLWEVGTDGTNLRPLLPGWNNPADECCGHWALDGRYFFFQSRRNGLTSIWAIDEKPGLFHHAKSEPFQLTTGPISFSWPVPSKDGKKLFAIGTLNRGEVVRYDAKSKQFLPFMQGLSAMDLDFTKDGGWVAYVSYPEGILWRSRIDGTDRMQLTSAPMQAHLPRWSPDGKGIAFIGKAYGQPWKIYTIQADGRAFQTLLPSGHEAELDPSWSPDGSQLAFTFVVDVGRGTGPTGIQILDLKTKEQSKLPDSDELFSPRWSPDGSYLAAITRDQKKLMLYDFNSQRWTELTKSSSYAGYPKWSGDGKYVSFLGLVNNVQAIWRVRIADKNVEQAADIKDIKLVWGDFGAWVGFAPDNSPLLLRNTGTQEIYALDLKLP